MLQNISSFFVYFYFLVEIDMKYVLSYTKHKPQNIDKLC